MSEVLESAKRRWKRMTGATIHKHLEDLVDRGALVSRLSKGRKYYSLRTEGTDAILADHNRQLREEALEPMKTALTCLELWSSPLAPVELPRNLEGSPLFLHLGEEERTRPLLDGWKSDLTSRVTKLNEARTVLLDAFRERWREAAAGLSGAFSTLLEPLPRFVGAYLTRDHERMAWLLGKRLYDEVGQVPSWIKARFDFVGATGVSPEKWEHFGYEVARTEEYVRNAPPDAPMPPSIPVRAAAECLLRAAGLWTSKSVPNFLLPQLDTPALDFSAPAARLEGVLAWFQRGEGKSIVEAAVRAEDDAKAAVASLLAQIEQARVRPVIHSTCEWLRT